MFGLGMPEILMILAIALIVIGPKKLPDLAKTLGRAMGEFKRSAQDFKHSIDVETSVKDIKDTETPDTDLAEIIKDDEKKDKKTDPGQNSDVTDPGGDVMNDEEAEIQDGNASDKPDKKSKNIKPD